MDALYSYPYPHIVTKAVGLRSEPPDPRFLIAQWVPLVSRTQGDDLGVLAPFSRQLTPESLDCSTSRSLLISTDHTSAISLKVIHGYGNHGTFTLPASIYNAVKTL